MTNADQMNNNADRSHQRKSGSLELRASRIGDIAQAFAREAQQAHDRRVRLEEYERAVGSTGQSWRATGDAGLYKLNQRGERVRNHDQGTAEMVRRIQLQQTDPRHTSGEREGERTNEAKYSRDYSAGGYYNGGLGNSGTKRPVLLHQQTGSALAGVPRLGLDRMSSMSDDSCHPGEGEDDQAAYGLKNQNFEFATSVGGLRKRKQPSNQPESAADQLSARL